MAHCPLEGDLQLWESSREHLVSTFLPLHTPPPPAHTHTHTPYYPLMTMLIELQVFRLYEAEGRMLRYCRQK